MASARRRKRLASPAMSARRAQQQLNGVGEAHTRDVTALVRAVASAIEASRAQMPVYQPTFVAADLAREPEGHEQSTEVRCLSSGLENICSAVASICSAPVAGGLCGSSLMYSLNMLMTVVSPTRCLSSTMLSYLLHTVLKDFESDDVLRRCVQLIHRHLTLHPPHYRLTKRIYYEAINKSEQGWSYILWAIEAAMQQVYAGDAMTSQPAGMQDMTSHQANSLLYARVQCVEWLVLLLEQDICHWYSQMNMHTHHQHQDNKHPIASTRRLTRSQLRSQQLCERQPLLSRLQPSWRRLLEMLVTSHLAVTSAASVDDVTSGVSPGSSSLHLAVLRLVCMCAEKVRLSSYESDVSGDVIGVASQSMLDFGQVLVQCIIQRFDEFSGRTLDNLLCMLRPCWLVVHVSAALLRWRFDRSVDFHQLSLVSFTRAYLTTPYDFARRIDNKRACEDNLEDRFTFSALVFHTISAHCRQLSLPRIHRHLAALTTNSPRAEDGSDGSAPLPALSDQLLVSYNRQLRQLAGGDNQLFSAVRAASRQGWLHQRFATYLLHMLQV